MAAMDEVCIQDVCFFVQWSGVQLHHAIVLEHLSIAKSSEAMNGGGSQSLADEFPHVHSYQCNKINRNYYCVSFHNLRVYHYVL